MAVSYAKRHSLSDSPRLTLRQTADNGCQTYDDSASYRGVLGRVKSTRLRSGHGGDAAPPPRHLRPRSAAGVSYSDADDHVRAFRGVLVGLALSILLFWLPLGVCLWMR